MEIALSQWPSGARIVASVEKITRRLATVILARLMLCSCLLAAPVVAVEPEVFAQRARTLRQVLYENMLPFWYPQSIDKQHGGYRLNHDIQGVYQGDSPKYLVTQARMLWFFRGSIDRVWAILGTSKPPDMGLSLCATRYGIANTVAFTGQLM